MIGLASRALALQRELALLVESEKRIEQPVVKLTLRKRSHDHADLPRGVIAVRPVTTAPRRRARTIPGATHLFAAGYGPFSDQLRGSTHTGRIDHVSLSTVPTRGF
jgi:hypothetical protein